MHLSTIVASLGLFASSALSVKVTAGGQPYDAASGKCTSLSGPANDVSLEPNQGSVTCNLFSGPDCKAAVVGVVSSTGPDSPVNQPASSVLCYGM